VTALDQHQTEGAATMASHMCVESKIPTFETYPFSVDLLPKEDGGGYVITFPDLPGCMSDGETVDEAIANGREAFRAWMESLIEDGKPIPEPHGGAEPANEWPRPRIGEVPAG
jgi:predicted RNase H-like HicB family nuclease